MPHLRLGIHLPSLRLPFKKALLTAKEFGADAVEIDARADLRPEELSGTGLRQVRKLLDDLNLRVAAVRFQTRRGYNVMGKLSERVEATKAAMRMSHDLGARVVVNHVGRVPSEAEGTDWELLVQVLTELGQFGQHVGATLAAKTGSESPQDLKRLIDALPEGYLAVDLDPGNLLINGFSANEAAEVLGAAVRHVHARDGVRDLAQGRGLEAALGRGAVDFQTIIATLEQHDYRGYYTLERGGENSRAEIARGVEMLRRM